MFFTGAKYLGRYPPGRYIPQSQVHLPGPGTPPRTRYTPQDQVHPPGTRYTPQAGTPPASSACWEIRATSGTHPTGMHTCAKYVLAIFSNTKLHIIYHVLIIHEVNKVFANKHLRHCRPTNSLCHVCWKHYKYGKQYTSL